MYDPHFSFASLQGAGLTNTHSEDLRDIGGFENRDRKATYCSGECGKRSLSRKGELVHVDRYSYPKECPKCHGKSLYFETISAARANKWLEER